MYMRIVVGLDGSEFAEQVLPHVEALATKFGSAVTLLRATTIDRTLVHLPAHMLPAGFPATNPIAMVEAERHAASTYLEGRSRIPIQHADLTLCGGVHRSRWSSTAQFGYSVSQFHEFHEFHAIYR